MKRTFSILLLMVFLFNVGGYYLMFLGVRHHHRQELNARLDANLYSAEEIVELKIPMSLPYPLQPRGFERVNGKFDYQGEQYKLVMHKLENDTLHVICIKDQEEKRLEEAMTEYANLANDLPAGADKAANLLNKLLKDFESSIDINLNGNSGWSLQLSHLQKSYALITQPQNILSPPPKV